MADYTIGIEEEYFLVDADTESVTRKMPEEFLEAAKKAIETTGKANAAEVAVKPIQDRLKMFENREAYREIEWVSP